MPSKKSATTVAKAPLPVRLRMRALERLSPQRGAAVAEKLWFTVPPAPTTSRLARFTPADGRPFFLMSGEAEISGTSFGPEDGPVALLVHGWGGYWQQLGAHVPALVEAGYRVVAFDAPGHGASTHGALGPGSGSVLEMTDAISAVVAECGTPALVVAHSIGAMALLRSERGRRHGDAYVLIAPQVRLGPAIDWFAEVTGMGPRTRELFVERLRRRIGLDLDDFDMLPDVARMVADGNQPPMLAVHDVDDPDAPAAETERLVAAWPGADLLPTRGLGHRRVIWDEDVVKRVGVFAHQQQHPTVVPLHPRG